MVHGAAIQRQRVLGASKASERTTNGTMGSRLLQTMKGDAVSNGAVAAPLVTAGGCVGVMAAELNDGGEQQDALLAAAAILASQLATLVGPPSARAKTEAEAVG